MTTPANPTQERITLGILRAYRQLLESGTLTKAQCQFGLAKLREIHCGSAGLTQMEAAELVQDYDTLAQKSGWY